MNDCIVRQATKEDAPFLAQTVMGALGSELCCKLAGGEEKMPLVRRLFTNLAASEISQYSYTNSLTALSAGGEMAGAIIAYDGARLQELRKAFIREANSILGWNIDENDEERLEAETNAGEIYIDSLFVVPAFRRKGIATALIRSVISHHKEAGKPVGLLVDPDNPKAKHTYESLGFREVGTNGFFGVGMIHMQYFPNDSI